MHLSHLEGNFRKRSERSGLVYSLVPAASESEIADAESRLRATLPDQVKAFYQLCNGLSVDEPALVVFSLGELERADSRIVFAVFDRRHRLAFDCSYVNAAGQWDILNAADDYRVTLTFSSFWSNKMWAWIDSRRPVWRREEYA